MKKIEKFCVENSLYIFILALVAFGMIIYISQASSNVPIMDYWRFLNVLVDKEFTSGVTFGDLYSNNGVHRSAYELFLFLLNVKIFHWNTQVSMYFSVFVLMISALVIYKEMKSFHLRNTMVGNWLSIVSILIVFSLGAYEIIAQEFATPSALRILFFLLLCSLTNKLLKSMDREFDNRTWLAALYYIFVIDLIGGAYSIGLAVAVLVVISFDWIYKRKEKKNFNKKNYLVLYFGLLLGIVFYMYHLELGMQESGVSTGFLELIGSFVKGLLLVGGISVFGTYISINAAIVLGIVVIGIHAVCLVIYVAEKLFEKTYVPAVLYIYSCFFYGMIFLGRSGYSVEYLASSRYITDSSFAMIADMMVIFLLMDINKQAQKKAILKVFVLIASAFFAVGIISTDIREIRIAPYRKEYCDNLIEMMKDIDNYTDEELAPFQASSPEMVRDGVELMRKYKLGVFWKNE